MTFDLRAVTAMIGTWRESSTGAVRRCHGRVLLWAAALAGFAMALTPVCAYALPVCKNTINGCCKITSSGGYLLDTSIRANGSYSACIRIKASHVFLGGQGYDIIGPAGNTTMKGVVIEPGANRAIVENFYDIAGFAISIEVDANQALVGTIKASDSGTGVIINGNHAILYDVGGDGCLHNGVVINGRGSMDYSVGGSFNDGNGVVVNSTAAGTYMWRSVDSENNHAGLKIKGVTSGLFDDANSTQNGTYGIWLRGSSNVSMLDFFAYENIIAGVYLGCHGHGPVDAPCPWGTPHTNANMLASSAGPNGSYLATANGGNVQQYGVVIDTGNHLNQVLAVQADGNTADDLYDGNPGCGGNLWWNYSVSGQVNFEHCYGY